MPRTTRFLQDDRSHARRATFRLLKFASQSQTPAPTDHVAAEETVCTNRFLDAVELGLRDVFEALICSGQRQIAYRLADAFVAEAEKLTGGSIKRPSLVRCFCPPGTHEED